MKLDRFINRPVLSTVISIVIVILGILGLFSLPISQYPDIAPPTVSVSTTYPDGIEQCDCPTRGADQRCGEYDVHDIYCNKYR